MAFTYHSYFILKHVCCCFPYSGCAKPARSVALGHQCEDSPESCALVVSSTPCVLVTPKVQAHAGI